MLRSLMQEPGQKVLGLAVFKCCAVHAWLLGDGSFYSPSDVHRDVRLDQSQKRSETLPKGLMSVMRGTLDPHRC